MSRKICIPESPKEVKTKSQALNYCLLACRKSVNVLGCALDCPLRKKWKIPPHGSRYNGE